MKFKKKLKQLLLFAGIIGMLTGCEVAGRDIQFFSGFAEDEVFVIGGEACLLPQAMIYIANQRNIYENAYSNEIWDKEIQGAAYKEHLLEQMKNFLAQMKCINLMARERGLELREEEELLLTQSAEEYFNGLSKGDREFLNVTLEDVYTAYKEYHIANKLIDELSLDEGYEVSDDEAKTIVLQQILIKGYAILDDGTAAIMTTEELAEKRQAAFHIWEQATAEDGDFNALIETYHEDERTEYTVSRGEMPFAFEKAAFGLETGEISGVVESEYGFHIIKCLNAYDIEATRINKERLMNEKKLEIFKQEYGNYIATISSRFNDALWDTIDLSGEWDCDTDNFFVIYEEYFR